MAQAPIAIDASEGRKLNERRRFNQREHAAMYEAADGHCADCGDPLIAGWHGDHIKPYVVGGPTDLDNGQALCPTCNLKKGSKTLKFSDGFTPRPFQRSVINAVLDGMASGRDTSVVLASPGSGKTLAYQAAATYARREGLIDYVAVFAPRIILAQQCETSWLHRDCRDGHCPADRHNPATGEGGYHLMFDASGRIGPIRHVRNLPPLTPPGQTGIGFVATYSSLVANPDLYESWARRNSRRFLLVADEAQFCGAANDERSGGTQAGVRITDLQRHAAHTLLLTGTPYRSDNQPLILADYDEPNEDGKRRLLCNAEASYADGIAESYLRRFEATVHDARVRWKYVGDRTVTEYDLSTTGADLADVLRKPEVWQPIADDVVTAIREKQKVNSAYRGLISCMEQKDAKNVYQYLSQRYADLRIKLAISEDGPDAERMLREFQTEASDVLVTVRKAFIGYDCPEITVVGILTHYRDKGHLMQLVGRGLRMWSGTSKRQQSCRVIAPDDPQMREFVEYMRGESEEGLRERARRESPDNPRSGGDGDQPLGYVESAYATSARAISNDVELDSDERLLYEALKHEFGSVDDVTVLAKIVEAVGVRQMTPASVAPVVQIVPSKGAAAISKTELESVEEINARTKTEICAVLAAMGVYPSEPNYGKQVGKITAKVNDEAGVRAPEARTIEQAEARLNVAMRMRERIG